MKVNDDFLKKKLTREEFEKAYEIAFDGFTKKEISEYCDEHFCNHDCKFFKRCMVEDIMDQNRSTPINPIDAEEYAYEILKEAGLK